MKTRIVFSIVLLFCSIAMAADQPDEKLAEQLKVVLHRKDSPKLTVVARIV